MKKHSCGYYNRNAAKFCVQCGEEIPQELEQVTSKPKNKYLTYFTHVLMIIAISLIFLEINLWFISAGLVLFDRLMLQSGRIKFQLEEDSAFATFISSLEGYNEKVHRALTLRNNGKKIKTGRSVTILLVIAYVFLATYSVFEEFSLFPFGLFLLIYLLSQTKLIGVEEEIQLSDKSVQPLYISLLGILIYIVASIRIDQILSDYRIRALRTFYFIIMLSFIFLGIYTYIYQVPRSMANNPSSKDLSLASMVLGVLIYLLDGWDLEFWWLLSFSASAVFMLLQYKEHNDLYRMQNVSQVNERDLGPNQGYYTSVQQSFEPASNNQSIVNHVEQVQTSNQLQRDQNRNSVGSISEIITNLDKLESRHRRVKFEYNLIVKTINKKYEEIEYLEQEKELPLGAKQDRLYKLKSELWDLERKLNIWDKEWVNLQNQLEFDNPANKIEDIERDLVKLKEKLPTVTDLIKNNSEDVFLQSRSDLEVKIKEIQIRKDEMLDIIVQKSKESRKVVPKEKISSPAAKPIPQLESTIVNVDDSTTVPFKLRSLISEKILSNLFAYLGATLVVTGFFFLIVWSYNNVILVNFPFDVQASTAIIGVVLLYLSATFFTFNNFLLRKFTDKLTSVSRFLSSFGLVVYQFTFYVQSVYFVNLHLSGNALLFPGILLVLTSMFGAYKLHSNFLSVTGVSIGMYLGFISASEVFQSSIAIREETFIGTGIGYGFLFAFNVVLIISSIIILDKKKIWLPLAVFSLFSPILWLQTSNNLALPAMLNLLVAASFIFVSITKRLPTPRPFSHFMTLFLLFYNNTIAIRITADILSSNWVSNAEIYNIVIVFSTFFTLYWIFVFHEKDLEISFALPMSFDYNRDQLKLKPIQRRLNLLMLTSLGFLFAIVVLLLNYNSYEPIYFFGILLNIMVAIGIKYNFEEIVKNSIILMIIESEVFFILILNNPNGEGIYQIILTGIFILSFMFIFYMLSYFRDVFNFSEVKVSSNHMAAIVGFTSIINLLLSGQSETQGDKVLLFGSLAWISISMLLFMKKNKDNMQPTYNHMAIGFGMMFQFIFGLLKQSSRFPIDSVTKNMSAMTHAIVNISLGGYLILAIITVIFGDRLRFALETDETVKHNDTISGNLKYVMSQNRMNVPQIILFILPSTLIIYGMPYFYYPVLNQAILLGYFMLYFILLPILNMVSNLRKNDSFGPLAAFTGYFAFIAGFVLLGGAKKLYDLIVNAPPPTGRGVYFIRPEWAILLIVAIFIFSVTWVIIMSNKRIQPVVTQMEVTA
ncbi:MAG: hypothetical protein INQ03_21115 [Candidatus Heimdallarchaeota archaeon]|nr:hypothetical protein [Candidatus Heimdallarchaeota archaeon]